MSVDHFEVSAGEYDGYELTCHAPVKTLAHLLGDDRITDDQARTFLSPRAPVVASFVRQHVPGRPTLDISQAMQGRVALSKTAPLSDRAPTNEEVADTADELAHHAFNWHESMTDPDAGRTTFGADLMTYLDSRAAGPRAHGTPMSERHLALGRLETGEPFAEDISDGTALLLLEQAGKSDAVARHHRGTVAGQPRSATNGVAALAGQSRDADRATVERDVDAFAGEHAAAARALRSWLTAKPTASEQLAALVDDDA